jgi:hypothetical protein
MEVFFLEASVPLTKTYTARKGEIEKTPYPMTWEFTSHRKQIQNLRQFEQLLKFHSAEGHCLLKGLIHRDLVKESRAGSTTSNEQTEWVCLDLDGVPMQSIPYVMTTLGLKDVSYIVQHSASSGIFDADLRAHIFMMLDRPATAPLLKQWLVHLNHATPELSKAMRLTKTGNSISWPLDISACQNDKLIYIAPPQLKGLVDPLQGKPRITLVQKKLDRLALPANFSTEKNKVSTHKRIAELREAEGLPKRSFKVQDARLHRDPGVARRRHDLGDEDRTRLRLPEPQWRGLLGLLPPENNPEFIFNFKGEPTYLTKELLPDYWEQLTQSASKVASNGQMYLAFCDRKTSAYWRGTYDQATDTLEIYQAKNETQLRHFAKQHGMPLGDFIPEWDLVFDPKDPIRVDSTNHIVNTFQPSSFMKATNLKAPKHIPPTIAKVMHHALGSDIDITEHFVNWLAFILQERDRTTTCWVLHGTEGTGKGILTTNVLRPIFGPSNTVFKRLEEIAEPYNPYMRGALLVVVDEVQTSSLANENAATAKLRNFITEEFVPIRAMHATGVEARNFTNWIFNSNKPDPVLIPKADRRHNVAKYQPVPLKDIFPTESIDDVKTRVAKELDAFFAYLLFYPVDPNKARTVIETEDRTTMIGIGESSIDTVSGAILEGNFEFLMDQLPAAGHTYSDNSLSAIKLDNYKHCLAALITRTNGKNASCNISREELRMIFEFVIGNMPTTPNKFTSLLKHHRIHIEKVWINNATASGIKTTWVADPADLATWLTQLQPKLPPNVVSMKQAAAAPKAKPAKKAKTA